MSAKFMKNAFVGWTFTAGLYYPPDFDQTKLMPLKHLKPKGTQLMNIRMMFPFTMICDSCHEYNYTGTKFTAKVEHIKSESYMGIKVYRFYARCRHCWAECTFKTDPKNSDYTMESGGKRTYEAWKDADMMEAQLKEEKQRDAELDQMKALEQKSLDAQAEMQRLEDLDAIRTMNKRLGARDQTIEEALEYLFQQKTQEAALEQELPAGDLAELEGFREAQDEQRRRRLDAEVDWDQEAASAAGGSTGSASSASGAGGAGSALQPRASSSGASGAAASAIASAVAERATSQASRAPAVGARLAVKRRAPASEEAGSAAKRPALADAAGEVVSAAPAAAAGTGGGSAEACSSAAKGGALGLGSYDSDSS